MEQQTRAQQIWGNVLQSPELLNQLNSQDRLALSVGGFNDKGFLFYRVSLGTFHPFYEAKHVGGGINGFPIRLEKLAQTSAMAIQIGQPVEENYRVVAHLKNDSRGFEPLPQGKRLEDLNEIAEQELQSLGELKPYFDLIVNGKFHRPAEVPARLIYQEDSLEIKPLKD